jgi:hypothetical protein
MNDQEVLTELEASVHRLQRRLARIERLLGPAHSPPSARPNPRAEVKDGQAPSCAGRPNAGHKSGFLPDLSGLKVFGGRPERKVIP